MSSYLLSLIPGNCLDVHALRTSKNHFVFVLLSLEVQYGQCSATESIPEVIRALNLTMRDVEEAWHIWRHNFVRATLQSGFVYIRARIRAACWRRHQGLPPAAFVGYQSLYPAFRYAGAPSHNNQSWGLQAEGGSLTQVGDVSMHQHTYGNPGVGDFTTLTQPSDPQRQFTPAPSHNSTHPVPQQYHAPPQSASVGAWDYPPPSYPPPHSYQQQQQQPLMPNVNAALAAGSPPPSPAVVAAVEVATRFLEAVNKAVNICIELNAM